MGFQSLGSSTAKTQTDLVNESMPAKPDLLEEKVTLPGLQMIHLMPESDLIDFFTTVLKMRPFVRSIDLTLGDEYNSQESQCTVPNSNQLFNLEIRDVARTLTMALASGGANCIGFRTVIDQDTEGNLRSLLYVKTADKPVQGPIYTPDGHIEVQGDAEFDPKLTIISKP